MRIVKIRITAFTMSRGFKFIEDIVEFHPADESMVEPAFRGCNAGCEFETKFITDRDEAIEARIMREEARSS